MFVPIVLVTIGGHSLHYFFANIWGPMLSVMAASVGIYVYLEPAAFSQAGLMLIGVEFGTPVLYALGCFVPAALPYGIAANRTRDRRKALKAALPFSLLGPDLMSVYDTLASMPLTTIERLLHRPDSPWFDDVRTPSVETRDGIIRRAFRGAVRDLEDRLGPDVRTWSWDRLHTVTFEHVFGADPRLAFIFNNGPFPVRGSHSTVSVGYYTLTQPYRMTVGSSTRQVYDLSNVNNSRSVLPPGQSGQAGSAPPPTSFFRCGK